MYVYDKGTHVVSSGNVRSRAEWVDRWISWKTSSHLSETVRGLQSGCGNRKVITLIMKMCEEVFRGHSNDNKKSLLAIIK